MDESAEQNESCSTVSENGAEHNTEDVPLIDHSDDEPLSFVPPRSMPNNRRLCSRCWLEILIGPVVLVFVLIVTIAIMLFIKDAKVSIAPARGCNKPSETGKSCMIDNLETTLLIRLQSTFTSSITKSNFTFVYTAVSHTSIITFSFTKGGNWYLGHVSIRDTVNNVELIEDGGFETGSLYAYCICDSTFHRTKPTAARYDQPGPYICDIDTFFGAAQLAQSVNTIPGRNYNVSFWLQSQSGIDKSGTVYMSSTSRLAVPSLRTKFIIICFIFNLF